MVSRSYMYGDIPILGPIGVAVTGISNVAVSAIGADFLRHGILFHNPNAATTLRVLPVGATLASGSGGIPILPYGFFELYDSEGGNTGNSNELIRCNCAWQVVADSASAAGLTIWNFTDNNQSVAAPAPVAHQNVDVDIASPNPGVFTGLTTASSTIYPANQNRRGLQLGNPGSTYLKGFSPANIAAAIGAGSIVLPPQSNKLIRAFGKVRINCGINAVTQNNADGTATCLEFV